MRFVEVRVWGDNQRAISLADFRHAGSIGWLEPITIAQYFGTSRFSNEIHGSVSEIVGRQPACDLIGRFAGTLEPLAGLSQLQELHLRNTVFTGQSEHEFCGETTRLSRDWWNR